MTGGTASDEAATHYREAVGHWLDAYDDWLALDPDSFALFAAFAARPWERDALTDRQLALVQVALDAAATHLHEAGLRAAVGQALDEGASVAEVREVLELACGLGMHAVIEGLPVVEAATDETGAEAESAPDPDRVRADFEDRRGYWSSFWGSVLAADPEYLDRYVDLSSHPWETGSLDPVLRELIYVAIDASTTHLYVPGLETHVENAIDHGATRAQLVTVLELVSLQGYDAMVAGMPILRQEAASRGLLE